MGFFLSWEDEYRDLFLSAKETMFFLASLLARFCLPIGKALPPRWQKLCHRHGKKFAKGKASGWQNFLLTDSELCGWQQSVSSASEYSPSEAIQEGA